VILIALCLIFGFAPKFRKGKLHKKDLNKPSPRTQTKRVIKQVEGFNRFFFTPNLSCK